MKPAFQATVIDNRTSLIKIEIGMTLELIECQAIEIEFSELVVGNDEIFQCLFGEIFNLGELSD